VHRAAFPEEPRAEALEEAIAAQENGVESRYGGRVVRGVVMVCRERVTASGMGLL